VVGLGVAASVDGLYVLGGCYVVGWCGKVGRKGGHAKDKQQILDSLQVKHFFLFRGLKLAAPVATIW